ncbi:Grx4 family monothiol glutaredoxin [Candidatus Cyanaurora vandensis]|uniref:Grx4 family monothiol glutaredoxin n=1 Tax=Candidatus Cyanaurora vandensis TaxID=2714958 RepID=UPI00257C9577|nr:Grx4 family monothiol glutaredoxin [Candidatus Cyanaurora vandensis]
MNDLTKKKLDDLITSNPVMVFMKGDRYFPQCGFSGAVVQILETTGVDYETVDVLSDPDLRQGIKEYSNWPTVPQVYIGGKFVGGSDILRELYYRGELQSLLEPVKQ